MRSDEPDVRSSSQESARGARPSDVVLTPKAAHALRSKVNALSLALQVFELDPSQRDNALAVARTAVHELSDLIDRMSGTDRSVGPAHAEAAVPQGVRVLVVEDEYLLAQSLSDQLRRAGCEVAGLVSTVHEALAKLPGLALDCAIVDANLDGEFSCPVVEALSARGIPAVILTGYDHAAIPRDLQALPYLQKPVDGAGLLRAIAQLQ